MAGGMWDKEPLLRDGLSIAQQRARRCIVDDTGALACAAISL